MTDDDIRLALPADLRRRVLVEAGHRCAIHTCRHIEVDIHHIEPWSQCREHRFENLIALCPNCHRRADAGEIDRKSLRMYKTRLAAAFKFDETKAYPDEIPNMPSFGWLDPQIRWRTLTEHMSDKERGFEADLEYPEFRLFGVDASSLNSVVREKISTILRQFCDQVVYASDANKYSSKPGYSISSSFAVALLQSDLVSIRTTVHSYAGGAHGSTWTETVNAFIDPFALFTLADFFKSLTIGIDVLSSYCINALLHPTSQGYPRDDEWIKSGAGPDEKNFSRFNLTAEGLLIRFDEYQIDCYAAGPSELLVPYSVFAGNIDERFRKALSIGRRRSE